MARRRRLEAPTGDELASIRATAAIESLDRLGADPLGLAPIAQVASDSVGAQMEEIARLRREAEAGRIAAERLEACEAKGLILLDLPLGEIDVDYLCRDRLPVSQNDESWLALKASIQRHGQRTPIEVAQLASSAKRYGLISGYRRLAALRSLFETNADPRWSRVQAIRRDVSTLGEAFVSMVQENELREALSHFERGRACVRAAEQGAFGSVEEALEVLFSDASPAKRSKIRSFITISEELGDLLIHPREIGERLGLRLAKAIRDGNGGVLRQMIGDRIAHPIDVAQEQIILDDILKTLSGMDRKRRNATPSDCIEFIGSRVRIIARRRGATVAFEVTGQWIDAEGVARAMKSLSTIFDQDVET